MEIVFLILALIITLITIYLIGRMVYTHKQLINAYKTSSDLAIAHIIIGITYWLFMFLILCAFNNTFWHLPYLTK